MVSYSKNSQPALMCMVSYSKNYDQAMFMTQLKYSLGVLSSCLIWPNKNTEPHMFDYEYSHVNLISNYAIIVILRIPNHCDLACLIWYVHGLNYHFWPN